jgi:signal peptidase I
MKATLRKLYHFSNTWTGTIIIVLLVIFFVAQAFVIPSGSMKRTLLVGDCLFVKKFSYGVPIPHLPWVEIPVLPDLDGDGHLFEGERPKREDIVVFRYPHNPKIHFVKRLFAVGGDEIIYQDKKMFLRPHEGDEYIKQNFDYKKLHTINGKLFVLNPYIEKYPGIVYDDKANTKLQTVLAVVQNQFAMKPIEISKGETAFYFKVPNDEYFMVGDNRDHSNDSRYWGSVPYKHIEGKPWFIYWSWDDDYKVRWNRIGANIHNMQFDKEYIDENESLGTGRT